MEAEMSQNTCDLCEERADALFAHPWRNDLMICYECRQDALDVLEEERIDNITFGGESLPF